MQESTDSHSLTLAPAVWIIKPDGYFRDRSHGIIDTNRKAAMKFAHKKKSKPLPPISNRIEQLFHFSLFFSDDDLVFPQLSWFCSSNYLQVYTSDVSCIWAGEKKVSYSCIRIPINRHLISIKFDVHLLLCCKFQFHSSLSLFTIQLHAINAFKNPWCHLCNYSLKITCSKLTDCTIYLHMQISPRSLEF